MPQQNPQVRCPERPRGVHVLELADLQRLGARHPREVALFNRFQKTFGPELRKSDGEMLRMFKRREDQKS